MTHYKLRRRCCEGGLAAMGVTVRPRSVLRRRATVSVTSASTTAAMLRGMLRWPRFALSKKPADTWTRAVRPPPSPPEVWQPDETIPLVPDAVWCEHCQDITRWCPKYGPDTLDESWKVFDKELRKEREKMGMQCKAAWCRWMDDMEVERQKCERDANAARAGKARKEETTYGGAQDLVIGVLQVVPPCLRLLSAYLRKILIVQMQSS